MSDATVHSAIRAVSGALLAAGIDEGRREARLLVAEVTGHDAARLLAYPEKVLTPAMLGDLDRMVARRAAREPLSRILGWREFYGRRFKIDPAVLDPRPDTETLVDIVLELMAGRGAGA